ncbi:MAG: LapA family protein [Alphaproteobacteria bacterium]|nr:LapA family protein [Alphaproteobacteria bacterium]
MRLLASLLFLLAAVAGVFFAVANRAKVAVDLDPFPFAFEVPLYLLVLAVFGLGLVIGGVTVGLGGLAARRRLKRQLTLVREKPSAPVSSRPTAVPASTVPALPPG